MKTPAKLSRAQDVRQRTAEASDKASRSGYPQVDWSVLVAEVKAGQDAGIEQLFEFFSRGIRHYLCRQLGPQKLEDKVYDTFLIVFNAIRRGDLREPECLMGFVRTALRRQVAAYIEQAVHNRRAGRPRNWCRRRRSQTESRTGSHPPPEIRVNEECSQCSLRKGSGYPDTFLLA